MKQFHVQYFIQFLQATITKTLFIHRRQLIKYSLMVILFLFIESKTKLELYTTYSHFSLSVVDTVHSIFELQNFVQVAKTQFTVGVTLISVQFLELKCKLNCCGVLIPTWSLAISFHSSHVRLCSLGECTASFRIKESTQ